MTSLSATDLKKTNLYLVGMMGAGKSTIGRKLAAKLGYRFLDTDTLIEQTAGSSVNELFAELGEAGFRELETQVLAEVSAFTNLVVATGGGVVTQNLNWSYLRHGLVIWLDVPVPVLVSRLRGDNTRPLLKDTDLTAKLTKLLEDREARYAQSDVRISYEGRSVNRTCDRILDAIASVLRPEPDAAADTIQINQTCINTVEPSSAP